MERTPFIPCDERRRELCKHGPQCEQIGLTIHHLRPRRLLKYAKQAQAGEDYLHKLKKLINHPNNQVRAPRCVHDLLDDVTNDDFIPEHEVDRILGRWNEAEPLTTEP